MIPDEAERASRAEDARVLSLIEAPRENLPEDLRAALDFGDARLLHIRAMARPWEALRRELHELIENERRKLG